jgi:xylose isomerase|tara:strand:+ start:83 stop:1402 length:1320 start_codon:yes stop_codon:yes gene_type:complete
MSTGEFFPDIKKIEYEGPESKNPLAFNYYNADEVVAGKTMNEWCRFAVSYWHTMRGGGNDPFGPDATIVRPWDDGSNSLDNALVRTEASFEFITKLGAPFYCFHDIDASPEGASLKESQKNLDVITDKFAELQAETDVKLLWATQNMFSHPRFMNGAATNPDLKAYAWAAAKTKSAMDAGAKLGAENHVFWGGREGYITMLNTDLRCELDNLAAFLQMAVDYKEECGYDFQFLIEPKPREPTKHQYDYDAQTCFGFLRTYGLEDHFKMNIEPNHTTLAGHEYEHDIAISSAYGMLGSIDCNAGDTLLGWDTDQYCTDIQKCTRVMQIVLEQDGIAPGGLNFDAKNRRESTDMEDFFIAHIGGMDGFARGLRVAAQIAEDDTMASMKRNRYASFQSPLGKKVQAGQSSFAELAAYAEAEGEPEKISGKQELYEMQFMNYH